MAAVAADAEQRRLGQARRTAGRRPRRATAARSSAGRPARSGDTVRKSSSTSPAARSEPNDVRAALGEDQPVPALAQQRRRSRQRRDRARPRARRPRSPPGARPASRPAPSSVVSDERAAREDGCAGSTSRRRVRTTTSGVGGRAEAAAELGERRRRRPGTPARASRAEPGEARQRARADHDRVGARAQEPHHEAVGRAPARRSACSRSGTDGIATTPSIVGDEVREQPRLVEAERAAVQRGEVAGQVEGGEAVGLVEQLERLHRRRGASCPAVDGDDRAGHGGGSVAAAGRRRPRRSARAARRSRARRPDARRGSPACRSPTAAPRSRARRRSAQLGGQDLRQADDAGLRDGVRGRARCRRSARSATRR